MSASSRWIRKSSSLRVARWYAARKMPHSRQSRVSMSFFQRWRCLSRGQPEGPRRESASELARSCVNHERIDFAENDVDAAGDARHNSAGGDCHKARHQSVLNQILTSGILPDLKLHYKCNHSSHFIKFSLLKFPGKTRVSPY